MPFRGLVTAFQPFKAREENHSTRVLNQWTEACQHESNWAATSLPVSIARLPELCREQLEQQPQVWLALGECDGTGPARLERVARNGWDVGEDAISADGLALTGVHSPLGPAQRRAHWPAAGLERAMTERGHRVELCDDAGSHCCNGLLWWATEHIEMAALRPWVGFLHLPREAQPWQDHVRLLADCLAWLEAQRRGSEQPAVAL